MSTLAYSPKINFSRNNFCKKGWTHTVAPSVCSKNVDLCFYKTFTDKHTVSNLQEPETVVKTTSDSEHAFFS